VRVVITGANGFVGPHVARELVRNGHDVVGIGLGVAPTGFAQLPVEYLAHDLAESWPRVSADAVLHLAGLSAVGPSFQNPQRYINLNSVLVTLMCEALLGAISPPHIVVVSTGAVYAPGVDLAETARVEASSPYAVSKLLVESQCEYYRRRGLKITTVRPFNHIGPGQQAGFLIPDLIAGLGRGGALRAGNLDTKRDYTDVRDVARAYRMILESPPSDEPTLNVCSRKTMSGRDMLKTLVELMALPFPEVELDSSRVRPGDPEEISGENALILESVGWSPEIGIEQTLSDVLKGIGLAGHD
jgi:GDP-4-dehydro-6-deoxy-D-mannose reductase